MFKLKYYILFPLVLLCTNCVKQNRSPFEVDTLLGVFTLTKEGAGPDSYGIEVNGKNILQDAYLFYEKENLVAIGSMGKLDIITRFSGDSTRGIFTISLFNRGKENLVVNQLSLFNKHVDTDRDTVLKAPILVAEDGWPWTWIIDNQENHLICSLDVSKSSIILLPEEELHLPRLEFFYHLCPE